ncbi:MAG: hypothetical protein KGJ90_04180 [Patescibacteria group bacterium]|nr:hypothetical protein [Patescibacteria group bacterium]
MDEKTDKKEVLTPPEFVKKNKKMIVLSEEPDGNWKGYIWKYEKLIEVRDYGPETILQALLVHDGN